MSAASKNRKTALVLAAVAVGMVGMAFAAVPLYRIFCQVTGFGGTVQRAEAGETAQVLDREVTVRFTGNVTPGLRWEFAPVQLTQTLKVGETNQALYRATNLSKSNKITGTATFNVTPHKAGPYFIKIQCFCFTEQTLEPGETVDMAVNYFVDPEIDSDSGLDDVTEITLSYTFFLAGSEPVAGAHENHHANTGAGDK